MQRSRNAPARGHPWSAKDRMRSRAISIAIDQVMGIAARFYPEVAALDSRDETGGEGFGVGVSA